MNRLMTGGEPFFFQAGTVGCLMVHGLTSAPDEMRPLGRYLAQQGITALGIRLSGHATHPSHLTRMNAGDWLDCLADGFQMLRRHCNTIILAGLSLGGALSLTYAASAPIQGVIALSTPYDLPPQPQLRFVKIILPMLRLTQVVLRYLPKPPPLDYRDPEAARNHLGYAWIPTRAALETGVVLAEMRRSLPAVHAPVLMIHSHGDRGVPPSNARWVFERLGSREKSLLWLQNSGHVITLEPERKRAFKAAADFIHNLAARRRAHTHLRVEPGEPADADGPHSNPEQIVDLAKY